MALPIRQQARYWGIAAAVFFALALGDRQRHPALRRRRRDRLFPRPGRRPAGACGAEPDRGDIGDLGDRAHGLRAGGLLVVPMLVRQLGQLVNAAPTIFGNLHQFLSNTSPAFSTREAWCATRSIRSAAPSRHAAAELATGLLSSALSVINARGLHRRRAGGGLLPAAGLGPHGRPGSTAAAARPRARRSAAWRARSTPCWPASCAARSRSA